MRRNTKRIKCGCREEWLEQRQRQGIGASEAAAAVGLSPWMTPLDLWKLKQGMETPRDLSGNSAVQQGVAMEPIVREFFAAMHPEYAVKSHPYDILYQENRPWLFATLDGELELSDVGYVKFFDNENGVWRSEYPVDAPHGVLEIKTASPRGADGWNEWADGHLPQHYFVQCLHQLLATGYDFVVLVAALFSRDGSITIKPPYEINRSDHEDDIAWLLKREEAFYKRNIVGGIIPSTPLML